MRFFLGSRLFLSRELAVSQSERLFWRDTRPGRKQAFPLKVRRLSSSVCGKGSLCQLIPDSSKVWKTQQVVARFPLNSTLALVITSDSVNVFAGYNEVMRRGS